MPNLSDTQRVLLAAAAQRDDRLAAPPRLPAAAAATVARSLLKAGLLAEAPLPATLRTAFAWRLGKASTGLAVTDDGMLAIGIEPVAMAQVVSPRLTLRAAAAQVLGAWDGDRETLAAALDALRPLLAGPTRSPRAGTKQDAVLALLRRAEGATITHIIDATAWQPHTVRGFLAGLKRQGVMIEVLERVRHVGPNHQGAKGSYSVYRVAASAVSSLELKGRG